MYIFPVPELETPNPAAILGLITGLRDEQWWFPPLKEPKTAWHLLQANDPVYEMYVKQFAIPREEFDNGTIRVRYYQLLPSSELRNHKDRNQNATLFINLKDFEESELYLYPTSALDDEPMVTIESPSGPYLLDGLEHHGARNFSTSPRIALAISFFNPYTFDMLEQMYKDRVLLKCQQDPNYRFVNGREHWDDGPVLDAKAV